MCRETDLSTPIEVSWFAAQVLEESQAFILATAPPPPNVNREAKTAEGREGDDKRDVSEGRGMEGKSKTNTDSRNFTAEERRKCGKTFESWNGREEYNEMYR